MSMQDNFIDARLNAADTQMEACVKLKCGLSTITNLETKGREPVSKSILANINEYIKKNKPKTLKQTVKTGETNEQK